MLSQIKLFVKYPDRASVEDVLGATLLFSAFFMFLLV